MENIIEELRKNYFVDGERVKYATWLKDIIEALDEFDQDVFEKKFSVKLTELQFPIITFDYIGSSDGYVFDAIANKGEIMNRAHQYFCKRLNPISVE